MAVRHLDCRVACAESSAKFLVTLIPKIANRNPRSELLATVGCLLAEHAVPERVDALFEGRGSPRFVIVFGANDESRSC